MNFEVTNKLTNEKFNLDARAITPYIKELFPHTTKKWLDNFIKIINNKNGRPFENDLVLIKPLTPGVFGKKLQFKHKHPHNENLVIGETRRYTEWIVFNQKTGKSMTFHNLSALARAIDISYYFLYMQIRNNMSFEIGNYLFTKNYCLEKHICNEMIREIMEG